MSEYRNYGRLMMLEPHYCKHVSAMTSEKLHDKGDIAAELAYRDKRIEELEAVVDNRNQAIQECHERMRHFDREVQRQIDSLGPLKIMADHPKGFAEVLCIKEIHWPNVIVEYPVTALSHTK